MSGCEGSAVLAWGVLNGFCPQSPVFFWYKGIKGCCIEYSFCTDSEVICSSNGGLLSTRPTALGYLQEYVWRFNWPPVHEIIHYSL